MAKIKSNLNRISKTIERRLQGGLEAAVSKANDLMVEDYSRSQSPPTSNPGEFPHIDTGQLVSNIDSHVENFVGFVGIKGFQTDEPELQGKPINIGGMAAVWLEDQGRLGIVDSWTTHEDEIRRAFERGSQI